MTTEINLNNLNANLPKPDEVLAQADKVLAGCFPKIPTTATPDSQQKADLQPTKSNELPDWLQGAGVEKNTPQQVSTQVPDWLSSVDKIGEPVDTAAQATQAADGGDQIVAAINAAVNEAIKNDKEGKKKKENPPEIEIPEGWETVQGDWLDGLTTEGQKVKLRSVTSQYAENPGPGNLGLSEKDNMDLSTDVARAVSSTASCGQRVLLCNTGNSDEKMLVVAYKSNVGANPDRIISAALVMGAKDAEDLLKALSSTAQTQINKIAGVERVLKRANMGGEGELALPTVDGVPVKIDGDFVFLRQTVGSDSESSAENPVQGERKADKEPRLSENPCNACDGVLDHFKNARDAMEKEPRGSARKAKIRQFVTQQEVLRDTVLEMARRNGLVDTNDELSKYLTELNTSAEKHAKQAGNSIRLESLKEHARKAARDTELMLAACQHIYLIDNLEEFPQEGGDVLMSLYEGRLQLQELTGYLSDDVKQIKPSSEEGDLIPRHRMVALHEKLSDFMINVSLNLKDWSMLSISSLENELKLQTSGVEVQLTRETIAKLEKVYEKRFNTSYENGSSNTFLPTDY